MAVQMGLQRAGFQLLTQSGFSLVELMIALTLGLAMLAGVTSLALNIQCSHNDVDSFGEQLENGRYALDIIKNDLRHAGFYGELYQLPTAPTALPDPCNTANLPALASGFSLAVQGYNNPSASPISCINNDDFTVGTDVLVVRHAAVKPVAEIQVSTSDDDGSIAEKNAAVLSNLKAGRIYLQTRSDSYILGSCTCETNGTCCSGITNCSNIPTCDTLLSNSTQSMTEQSKTSLFFNTQKEVNGLQGLSTTRAYHVHIYYIRQWSAKKGDGIPTLVRVVLGDGGSSPIMNAEPLIEGIERMEVQYGIDTSSPVDGAPDSYIFEPWDINEWLNVVTVRIHLLTRSVGQIAGYTDSKSYDLGEGLFTLDADSQRHRHHVLTAVVRLNNVSGRRE
jgi:type IV pilus assembly protein PilW